MYSLRHVRIDQEQLQKLESPVPVATTLLLEIRGAAATATITPTLTPHPLAMAGHTHWQDVLLEHIDAAVICMLRNDDSNYVESIDGAVAGTLYRIDLGISYVTQEPSSDPDVSDNTDMSDNTVTLTPEVSDIQRDQAPDPAPLPPSPAPSAFRGAPVSDNQVRTSPSNPSNVSRLRR